MYVHFLFIGLIVLFFVGEVTCWLVGGQGWWGQRWRGSHPAHGRFLGTLELRMSWLSPLGLVQGWEQQSVLPVYFVPVMCDPLWVSNFISMIHVLQPFESKL